jgi:putative hemolysin
MSDILIIVVLVLINATFSMSEMALASSRRARLQNMGTAGSSGAKAALALMDSPSRFLSTVQLFITLISILQGVFGGQALTRQLSGFIAAHVPALAQAAEPLAYLVVIGGITYVSLVAGELVPKRLALQYPEQIASLVAQPMQVLASAARPFVWFLSASTNGVIRLLGIRATDEASVTEMEVLAMVEEGVSSGIFEEEEQDMVAAVFRLDERRIGSLMTPRPDIIWLDLNDTPDAIAHKLSTCKYSSYPVGRDNIDNIVGIVQSKDLVAHLLTNPRLQIDAIMTPPVFLPETASVATAIQVFRREGVHTILVINEYGGIDGLIRMQDIMEQVFGETETAETEQSSPSGAQRVLEGQYPIERLAELYDSFQIPQGDDGRYETLAGFVMTRLKRVPEPQDQFEYGGLRFTVVAMDGVRIDRVSIETLQPRMETQNEQS